jgi:predicted DNA-binding transcriptional regulator AlpA
MKTPIAIQPIFIAPSQIQDAISISRASAYKLLKDDPTFPRLRMISTGRVAWLRHDLEAWAQVRPFATDPKESKQTTEQK